MKNKSFQKLFEELAAKKLKAFVPFTVIGDPNSKVSFEIIKTYIDSGADMLELGIPFSDPTADGPTIQEADQRALKSCKMEDIFEILRDIRKYSDIPISLLTYYNPIFRYGHERFFALMAKIGVQGVLIADLPLEEASMIAKIAKEQFVDLIFMLHEKTGDLRFEKIQKIASGYYYLVSSAKTTGEAKTVPKNLGKTIKHFKKTSKLPILVGFGISNKDQVNKIYNLGADGVVVGSKLVALTSALQKNPKQLTEELKNEIRQLKG